ncbi:MAG: hypothetical protein Q9227_007770 [Pyrenula ochraceoflavens]
MIRKPILEILVTYRSRWKRVFITAQRYKTPIHPGRQSLKKHSNPTKLNFKDTTMSQTQSLPKIFIIGGTGAQGSSVIHSLALSHKYHCVVLTRNPSSPRATSLSSLPNVSFLTGSFASEATLRTGFTGCTGAFVNIDGFNCGEKTETYWAMRAYELALECGVEIFVYGNIDFGYRLSGYDAACRCGHVDGKGRVGEWILWQNERNGGRMKAGLLTTGPYMNMTVAQGMPMSVSLETPKMKGGADDDDDDDDDDGVVAMWRMPLGPEQGEGGGAVPFVSLEDTGVYALWMFDHPDEASGLNLKTAIGHFDFTEVARAFETVTGHPARYIDTPFSSYWATGPLSSRAEEPSAYNSTLDDPSAMTVRQNFTGWWETYRRSGGGGNKGVLTRDYELLDRIFPERVRSVEEWLRREDGRGRERGDGGLWERVRRGRVRAVTKKNDEGWEGAL